MTTPILNLWTTRPRNCNPHTPPLGRFLRSLESHVTHGYVTLRNGQIVRDDTWKRWGVGLRSERATRRAVRHGRLHPKIEIASA